MRPIREVRVQKALIATIEASIGNGVLHQVGERFERWSEHVHAGVETIGPADIWGGGQFFPLEQLVAVAEHQRVGIEEDTLLELRQTPAV